MASSSSETSSAPHQSPKPLPSTFTAILTSLRPWTFSASLSSVVLGASLSYRLQASFNPIIFMLSLGAVLAVNGAGNMVNSYFETMRKRFSDAPTRNGGNARPNSNASIRHRKAISSPENREEDASLNQDESTQHQLDQTALVNYAALFYGFGMLCMLLLMHLSTAKSEFIAALFFGGLSISFLYTGGIRLKYYILGDLLVVFTFGPLSMLFAYGVQSGEFPKGPLLLAFPLTLSTEAILHSKHLREVDEDRRAGVISLAVLLGKQGSYFLFTLLLFLPYLLFAVFATQYSLSLGLPLLSMPYAFQLERTLRESGPSKAISVQAAKLNICVSALFIIGCLLAKTIPFH